MTKRVRTSRSTAHRRPGARPQNRAKPRTDVRPVSQLEAAAVIADDLADARPSEAAAELERAARATYQSHRVKPGSVLAAKAASEYVYVAQDMRRIALVAAGLFGVLLVAWLLIVVLRVIPLPFY